MPTPFFDTEWPGENPVLQISEWLIQLEALRTMAVSSRTFLDRGVALTLSGQSSLLLVSRTATAPGLRPETHSRTRITDHTALRRVMSNNSIGMFFAFHEPTGVAWNTTLSRARASSLSAGMLPMTSFALVALASTLKPSAVSLG